MYLTSKESTLIFSIMQDLSGAFDSSKIRRQLGEKLLDLLDADHFASYVWDEAQQKFISGVSINMGQDNLQNYQEYYQFHDPITPTLQKQKKATSVSRIMNHDRLARTEFYNDFLLIDGLHYGLNYFAYDCGKNIGDLRIWRRAGKEDFSPRDEHIIDALGPSVINALIRANLHQGQVPLPRFIAVRDRYQLTTREAEIADLIVAGLSDENICRQIGVSKPTLRTHIGSIFRKVNIKRRSQLAFILSAQHENL